ncbi:MAG: hypothetical protein GYB33_12510 [Gammaproteobacteria bacterium]|nr:hypothetical protein [Gammaproteobacteria bacterium]
MVTGKAFDSNVLSLIPQSQETGLNARPQFAEDSHLQKSFVILITHPQTEQAQEAAVVLRELLAVQPGITVHKVGVTDQLRSVKAFFQAYRNQLLTPRQRAELLEKDPAALVQDTLFDLYSPVPAFRPYPLELDPLNLGAEWMQELLPGYQKFIPGTVPSIQKNNRTWFLVRGEVQGSPFEPGIQQLINGALVETKSAYSEVSLLLSGLVFHATEATQIAKREISTVGLGSLLGILLLVICTFRSAAAMLAIMFTLASSLLLALTITLAVFDSIHLITLAFGSTLLGLAVDYCFHFLVKYRRYRDSLMAGKLVLRGLLLSAGSSILAYMIQLFSPFPGLQQFAVFVASGLAGACLSIIVLFLFYRELTEKRRSAGSRLFTHVFDPLYSFSGIRRIPLLPAFLLLIPGLLLLLNSYGFSDDIRLLNTSSPELLDNELQVRNLLGGLETQRYWVVEGRDEQQVLARSEQMIVGLPAGVQVMSLTQMVPSLERQRRDNQLIAEKVYAPKGAAEMLCQQLSMDCSVWLRFAPSFQPGLAPSEIPAAIVDTFPFMFLGGQQQRFILPYLGQEDHSVKLASIERPEGVSFVDKVEGLSKTMSAFRADATQYFLLFLLLLVIALYLMYGVQGVIAWCGVLVSMLTALALSAGEGITLFHILALLLVMGIALDMAIFYLELGLDEDTWLASTLAIFTSILAFGLLSLSQVPLLHHFGSVVFYGLLCAWVITPIIYRAAGVQMPGSTGRTRC